MVIKVYVAMISCSQEVKKNQQRAIMILESKNVPYMTIDITDPGQEEAKEYMHANAVPKEGSKVPITPQIFNEAEYCGDFDQLDMANECDNLGEFLKLTEEEKKSVKIGIMGILPEERERAKQQAKEGGQPSSQTQQHLTNGVTASREGSAEASNEASKELTTEVNMEETTNMQDETTTEVAEKVVSEAAPAVEEPVAAEA